jgi:hypothetical protein
LIKRHTHQLNVRMKARYSFYNVLLPWNNVTLCVSLIIYVAPTRVYIMHILVNGLFNKDLDHPSLRSLANDVVGLLADDDCIVDILPPPLLAYYSGSDQGAVKIRRTYLVFRNRFAQSNFFCCFSQCRGGSATPDLMSKNRHFKVIKIN